MLPVMQWLAEAGFTALAISLRGHGDSTGDVIDFGWSARYDVAAAVAFLEKECPQQPIYIVGRSMGAAAAIFAAGELKDRVAGYFLEQPYKDLRTRSVEPTAECAVARARLLGVSRLAALGAGVLAGRVPIRFRRTTISRRFPRTCRLCSSRGRPTGMPGSTR